MASREVNINVWGMRSLTEAFTRLRDERDAALAELDAARAREDRVRADRDVLAVVGRMYLEALDEDPENEALTLPEAFAVSQVRDAVAYAALDAVPADDTREGAER